MMSYDLRSDIEEMFFGESNPRRVAKRRLNEFYDKFGESRMAIENLATNEEYSEYLMLSGYENEVLRERREARMAAAKEKSLLQRDTAQEMRDDMAQRKEENEENDLQEAEEHLERIEEAGKKAVDAYKNLDREKIKEDTDKYVNQTMEEQREIKRKCAGYSFDKVYYTQVINGKEEKGTQEHEGGYSNNEYDLGGKTNYGVTQGSLEEYKKWHNSLKTENNLPSSVKNLSSKQAKTILEDMYYKRYRLNYIPNLLLARVTFDHCVNVGPKMNKNLFEAVNEVSNTNFKPSKVISNELVDKISTLSEEQVLSVRDKMVEKKMEHHFKWIDEKPNQINFLDGWYQRSKSQYSDQGKFEDIYAQKRLKYFDKYFSLLKGGRIKARIKKELERVKK